MGERKKVAEKKKNCYFVREVESVFHSFKSHADAVRKNGQEYGHQENIGIPFLRETVLSLQCAIIYLCFK